MKKKKNIKLIIGSNNVGKIKEISDLFPKKIEYYTPKQLNIKSPKETGKTFKEVCGIIGYIIILIFLINSKAT